MVRCSSATQPGITNSGKHTQSEGEWVVSPAPLASLTALASLLYSPFIKVCRVVILVKSRKTRQEMRSCPMQPRPGFLSRDREISIALHIPYTEGACLGGVGTCLNPGLRVLYIHRNAHLPPAAPAL